jgi:hypothetical protein
VGLSIEEQNRVNPRDQVMVGVVSLLGILASKLSHRTTVSLLMRVPSMKMSAVCRKTDETQRTEFIASLNSVCVLRIVWAESNAGSLMLEDPPRLTHADRVGLDHPLAPDAAYCRCSGGPRNHEGGSFRTYAAVRFIAFPKRYQEHSSMCSIGFLTPVPPVRVTFVTFPLVQIIVVALNGF